MVTSARDGLSSQLQDAAEQLERIVDAHEAERERLTRQLAEAMRQQLEAFDSQGLAGSRGQPR